ncbi:competence protein CoiA [Carnobacterium jeotgali]|uniref:competence protein CoiA n=1 Tax=Carnobacterium jeotgali TaxID=545534 RepID=UPI003C770218
MLVAVNNENVYVNAMNVQRNIKQKTEYFCPNCKELVFLKKGLIKQAHFTHFQKSDCAVFSEGETEEHVSGKAMLYQWFIHQNIPCQLEAYLPNLKQRPDLLIWLDEQTPVAIEFQCSSLSAQRMIERTNGYIENGYKVYWILGGSYHFKHKLTSFQKLFIKEHKKIGCYFLELNVDKSTLTVHFNINQYGNSSQIASYSAHIELTKANTNLDNIKERLLHISKAKQNELKNQLIKSQSSLNKGRNYQVPEIVAFQKYIYKRGDSLISLPVEVYLPVKNQLFIKTLPYFWKYQLLEWIMNRNSGEVISKKEVHNKFFVMIQNNELVFHLMPFISLESKKRCIDSFMALLTERGLLSVISNSDWMVQREPQRYENEKEKIADFLALDYSFATESNVKVTK